MSFLYHKDISHKENVTILNRDTYLKVFIGDKNIGNIFDKTMQKMNSKKFSSHETWKTFCNSLIDLAYNNLPRKSERCLYEIYFTPELLTYIDCDDFKFQINHEKDRSLCNFLENIKKLPLS